MSKCSICHKNEAVIYTSRNSGEGSTYEGICLSCAFKEDFASKNPAVIEMLKSQGITRENVEHFTQMINSTSEAFAGKLPNMEKMGELLGALPEEFGSLARENQSLTEKKGETEVIDQELDRLLREASPEITAERAPDSESIPNSDATFEEVIPGTDEKKEQKTALSEKGTDTSSVPRATDKGREERREASEAAEKSADTENVEEAPFAERESNISFAPASAEDASTESPEAAGSGRTEESFAQSAPSSEGKHPKDEKYKYLNQYGRCLNEKARAGELDPLIGREKEMSRIIQILNRRSKNNPVLLGEPGVGKTALAEGLAQRIVSGDVPEKLLDLEIYLLDMTALVAGTQFRGQFEARMKNVVDEASAAGNVVLVIDELHNIMGAGDAEGAMNAANILKPALSRGEIRVLGSTTLDEYRRFIEKDSALERRFQQVLVEEPGRADCLEILKGSRPFYERHHHVRYSDDVLESAVRLSSRYIHERFLPDKAIDLIDEAGSRANLDNRLLVELHRLHREADRLKMLYDRLLERGPEEGKEANFYEVEAEMKASRAKIGLQIQELNAMNPPQEITSEDIAAVISLWTGIPTERLTESQSERLLQLESRIHRRLIGQEKAVSAVSRAIRRSRAGFGPKHKPASFIFVGPTGVGKTELVKALAEALFDREDAFIRLDMSEYMEAHTVSKLIGSPPGYVGYDDGGQLTEKVRRKPYSVILLDEIEKAHPEVFNMLLQLLDEGRLTDSHGRLVNFENTVIIMTSNAGTSMKANGIGFGTDASRALEERVKSALHELFRPEFLNRVDEIIVFRELDRKELRRIVELMLEELYEDIRRVGAEIEISDAVKDLLCSEGYDPRYGARPLRKTITRLLEDPLADALLSGELTAGKKVRVRLKRKAESEAPEGKIQFLFEKSAEEETQRSHLS